MIKHSQVHTHTHAGRQEACVRDHNIVSKTPFTYLDHLLYDFAEKLPSL